MSFLNRFLNRQKSDEAIRAEITQRRAAGRPTKQLEDEMHARMRGEELHLSIDGAVLTEYPPPRTLEQQKAQIESAGGWTGPVNRAINRGKSTSDISAEIAMRRAQGKPTRQLEDELDSR